MRHAAAVFLILCIAGCEAPNEIVNPGTLSLPFSVALHVGQYIRLPQGGFTATFDSVTADSRCPLGVDCFWSGDGELQFSVITNTDVQHPSLVTLHTTLEPQAIVINGFVVRLRELDPIRSQIGPIDPSSYVAVLEIDRSPTYPTR